MHRSDLRKKNAPQGRFSLADSIPGVIGLLFLLGWLTTSHISPWVSWHAELPVFIAAFALAWMGILKAARHGSGLVFALPPATWPLLVMSVCALIQYLLGQIVFIGVAFTALLYLLMALISICLGATTSTFSQDAASTPARSSQVDLWLAGTLLLVALLSVGVGLSQVLQISNDATWILRTTDTSRAAGNVGQPNHLATLLVMAMASGVYLYSIGRVGRGVLMLSISFILLALVATGSRSGMLGLTLLVLWWLWKQPVVTPGLPRWFGIPFAIGFVAIQLLWAKFLSAYDIVGQSGAARLAEGVADPRLTIWPQLLEAAGQRPWLGWGIRNTAEAHATVVHAYGHSLPVTYSHNLVIDLAIWVGFPLASLTTVAALYWLWIRARTIAGPKTWFGLAVAIPLGVHSMFEFPYAYAYLLAPAMVGIGIVEGAARTSYPVNFAVRPFAALLAVLTAGAAWSVVEYLRAEEDFHLARFEMLRIGPEGQADNPAKLYLLTQLRAVNEAGRLQPGPGMRHEEIETLRRVADHSAWSGARYRYAVALALNGKASEASRQMQILQAQHGLELHDKLKRQLDAEIAAFLQSGGGASKE